MSATNHTTNYGLSQFLGTDKPAWLVDYNGDMALIDQGIKDAADAASAAQTTANTADGKADTNAANITTLDTQINGVSGIATDVNTLQGSVNTITSLIGNGEPTTSDKTLIGAINELNNDKADAGKLNNKYVLKSHHVSVSETHDGTLTIGDQMASLVTKIKAAAAALEDGEFIRVTGAFVYTPFNYPMYSEDYSNSSNNINTQLTVLNVNTVPDAVDFFTIYLNETACKMYGGTFGGSQSDTWSEESSTIATSDAYLYYDVYAKI